ncbi:MAG: SDR family NAD(P)-dependent oxidoreductase, partial [Acidobacteriota bacterium]
MTWICDRHAVVTGGGGGLGAALCRRLLERGCRVSALDIDADGLATLPADVARAPCDLRDGDAVLRAVEAVRRVHGPVDVAVANAGVTHIQAFRPGQSEAVRRVMAVNFFGAVHLLDAVVDDLKATRGQATAISSVAGYAPLVGRTAYAASKHAMHGFFDTLRLELRNDGVDVLVVCPSSIATGIRQSYTGGGRGPDPTVGREDSPERAAAEIVRAIEGRRRFLAVGRVG